MTVDVFSCWYCRAPVANCYACDDCLPLEVTLLRSMMEALR